MSHSRQPRSGQNPYEQWATPPILAGPAIIAEVLTMELVMPDHERSITGRFANSRRPRSGWRP